MEDMGTTAYTAGMIGRAAILAGPDYFTCERTHCRIKKTECITRQTEGIRERGAWHWQVPP